MGVLVDCITHDMMKMQLMLTLRIGILTYEEDMHGERSLSVRTGYCAALYGIYASPTWSAKYLDISLNLYTLGSL